MLTAVHYYLCNSFLKEWWCHRSSGMQRGVKWGNGPGHARQRASKGWN